MFSSTDIATFAAIIVAVLGHFGVPVATNDVITVIADLVVIVGVVLKYFQHKTVQAQVVAGGGIPKA